MTIKAQTTYTKDLILKFTKFSTIKSSYQIVTYIILELVMLVMGLLFIITSENKLELIISIVIITPFFLSVVPIILIAVPRLTAKISKNTLGCVNTYEFSEEEMLVHSSLPTYTGNGTIKYNFLQNVYETSDTFYLFVSKHHAFIVNKSDITEGTVSDLQQLLRKNLSTEKYVKKNRI